MFSYVDNDLIYPDNIYQLYSGLYQKKKENNILELGIFSRVGSSFFIRPDPDEGQLQPDPQP